MFDFSRWTIAARARHNRRMFGIVPLLMALAAPASALAGTIGAISVDERTVTIRFDDQVAGATTRMIAGPERITIDIDGARTGPTAAATGFVRAVRQGQQGPDLARVVFDLGQPAVVTGGAFAADGRSLTLSWRPASADEFAAAARTGAIELQPPPGLSAKPPRARYSVSTPIGKPAPAAPLPRVEGPNDPQLPLVVIDAGHGGHDPGAISPHSGKREKDVTLAIARAIRAELLATGRVRVALTRSDDRYLMLEERYGIARRLKADLFMSIHADSAPNQLARGASVYTLSEVASDREAARLAARENKANVINGVDLGQHSSDVSSILIDLTQRETMNIASDFARLLRREASKSIQFRTDSHRFASFVVLKSPDTPSILFETGFMSNEQDSDFLASADGQRKLARGVRDAVQAHFARQIAAR